MIAAAGVTLRSSAAFAFHSIAQLNSIRKQDFFSAPSAGRLNQQQLTAYN